MLTKRIIACLDVDGGRVVKGVQFVNLRDAGDPAELAAAHSEAGADEIVLLDISATAEKRKTLLDTVRQTARRLFIPFTVGGGIRSLKDASAVFEAGADKVSLNSAALSDPALITRIAERFGSQAVVVAVDAKRVNGRTSYEAFSKGGRTPTGREACEWAIEAQSRGAGEILLTSMDRDGTGAGFDCELTRLIATSVRIPVIASGGAGSTQHFAEVFREGQADAALAASILHYGITRLADLKQELAALGIPMRWPC
jgi:cyclase